jgi:hypothetical protein
MAMLNIGWHSCRIFPQRQKAKPRKKPIQPLAASYDQSFEIHVKITPGEGDEINISEEDAVRILYNSGDDIPNVREDELVGVLGDRIGVYIEHFIDAAGDVIRSEQGRVIDGSTKRRVQKGYTEFNLQATLTVAQFLALRTQIDKRFLDIATYDGPEDPNLTD